MAWLDGPGVLPAIPKHEFRCALRFVLGMQVTLEDYACDECGRTADCYGYHAVSCLLTGEIGRGHTCLKYVLDQLFTYSGCSTIVEHPLPDGSADHPKAMDIVVTSGLGPSQLAVDVTIINPSRPSAMASTAEAYPALDKAASEKLRKYSHLCTIQGWKFAPMVFDVFGASHPTARGVLKKVIKRLESRCPVEEKASRGRLVWASVTTAVISRTAKQLGRVTQANNPAGLPLSALSWRKRQREIVQGVGVMRNTGNFSSLQPSSLTPTASPPSSVSRNLELSGYPQVIPHKLLPQELVEIDEDVEVHDGAGISSSQT